MYVARIVAAILEIAEVVNVTNAKINGSAADLSLVETADQQQIPSLGTVVIGNG